MTSQVVEFPIKISCSDCENFMCGPLGSYCAFWREEIVDESTALDCSGFERF